MNNPAQEPRHASRRRSPLIRLAGRYVRLTTRVVPPLGRRSRAVRLAVAAGLLVPLVASLAAPVAVALTAREPAVAAMLVGMTELVGLGVAACVLYLRRISRTLEVRSTRIEASLTRTARTVNRIHDRSQRQGVRSLELAQNLRAVDRTVRRLSQGQPLLTELGAAEQRLKDSQESQFRQYQAMVNLFHLVTPRAAVPPLGGWAAAPDLALLLTDELLRVRPKTVVECGSGVTTLFLALAISQYELPTRLVTLEHEEQYWAQTRALLDRHGVAQFADVRHAPLRATSLEGHRPPWYDDDALEGVQDVGLLFVDGPPGIVGGHARRPALPLLKDRLAPTCTVILDDMHRVDEQQVADEWAAMLPDFERADADLQRGAAVFRRG